MIKEPTNISQLQTGQLGQIRRNPSHLDNILKSNTQILRVLTANNLLNKQDGLMDIIQSEIFKEKMTKLFKFYKPRGNENLNQIMNKKLLNHYQITDILANLIVKLSDILNLNLDQTFDLVDLYFQQESDQLEKLLKKENYMKAFESSQSSSSTVTEKSLIDLRHHIMSFTHKLQEDIVEKFYEERINLLKSLQMFISISFHTDKISNECKELLIIFNEDNQIVKNLWEIYKSYTIDFRINKQMDDFKSKEKHTLQILKEQVHILDTFILFLNNYNSAKNFLENPVELIEVFAKQKFMGYFFEVASVHHLEEFRVTQEKYAQLIMDQCVMLIIIYFDLKYLYFLDNNIKSPQFPEFEVLDMNKMPFIIFKKKESLESIINLLEICINANYIGPIFMIFSAIYKMVKSNINKNNIRDNEIINLVNNVFDSKMNELENRCDYAQAMDFLSNMFNRLIFLIPERELNFDLYKAIIKFWLNMVIKYSYQFCDFNQLIELCVKSLNSSTISVMFWATDYPHDTPLKKLYTNILDNFPNNFEQLISLNLALKGNTKKDFYLSGNVYDNLTNLHYFNIECTNEELVSTEIEGEVELSSDIPTNWGFILPQGSKGEIIAKIGGNKYHIRFHYEFSLFSLIYYKWGKLIENLYNIPKERNFNINEFYDNIDYNTTVQFINLFAYLIANDPNLIDNFFNDYLKGKEYINVSDYLNQFKIFMTYALETINLLTQNWQLYSFLQPLVNSIYSMIESFLHNPKVNQSFITVIISDFVSGFQGVSSIKRDIYQYGSRYSRNTTNINIVEIFGNTLLFDANRKTFENTILVFKIIKNFFKFPHILEFVKNVNSYEFLINIWNFIIVEYIKTLSNQDYFYHREEFEFSREIVKIIQTLFKIITNASSNKAVIISKNENYYNPLNELVLSCLNSIETSNFVLKILKTRVVYDNSEKLMKDKINLRNILWDNFAESGEKNYFDKITAKRLILTTFECLNQIFDLILLHRNTTDSVSRNFFDKFDTLRLWNETLFINKIIPTFDSRSKTNEVYTINLILNIFSYIDYEDRESLDYTKTFNRLLLNNEDESRKNDQEIFFYDVLNFQRKNDKDLNICTLSISCLNRILVILKLQSSQLTETTMNITKISNMVNYLYLKKESSRDLENSLNLFDKFKEIFFINLLKPIDYSYKIEIVKFLAESANSQIKFMTQFFEEDLKLSQGIQIKNFWDIFGRLTREVQYKDRNKFARGISFKKENEEDVSIVGYLSIFISNIFTNDVLFKKTIRELITSHKDKFDYFLDLSIDMFSLKEKEDDLQNSRDFLKENVESLSHCKNYLITEEEFRKKCFNNLVNKSICIILSKLIVLSDNSNYMTNKFQHYKEVNKFLNQNISNFIQLYNCKLNYDFINNFNYKLTNDKNIQVDYSNDSIQNYSKSKMIYNRNYEQENVINIEKIEKVIENNSENYFLSFTIDPYSGVFNYSVNYWVDLKELFINMKIRNYNVDLFIEYFNTFIEHNLELSLFESKCQTMYSVTYLMGLIFSIGIKDSLMSTNLFTGKNTFSQINKNDITRDFTEKFLSLNRNVYPKLNFNLLSKENLGQGMSINEFKGFVEDKILRHLELDLDFYNSRGRKEERKVDSHFNFYNQYISNKYNILSYIVNYLIYLYNDKDDLSIPNLMNFPHNTFQKHFMKILNEIDKDFPIFIQNYKNLEIEKCILTIINVIHSILTYLMTTEYDFTEYDINCLNSIINNLLVVFERIPHYQAIIIFVINAYANLSFFQNEENSYKNRNLNIIFNQEDHRIIKLILKKLSQNISEQEYLAIVTFMITLVNNYDESLEMIINEKILLAFQINDKFNNSLGISLYQENERGVNHILWCWTIIFLRQVCLKLNKISDSDNLRYYSIYNSIIDFIINHEVRIVQVLNDTEYVDQGGNHIHKSLAYLEELEYISGLLNILFIQSKKWKNTSSSQLDFHNRFITLILSKTMRLFSPNIKISNHYKCFSTAEKTMNDIFPSEMSDQSKKDERYTSFFSPMKKSLLSNVRKENVNPMQMSPRREFSKNINPNVNLTSIFYYRVDISLNKILYNLTNMIKSAVHYESFSTKTSYINHIREMYSRVGSTTNLRYFDDQCQNLIYSLYFALHSFDSITKNYPSLENLYRMSVIFFNNINSSVNFGNLNLIYSQDRYEDVFFINSATIQNIFLINSTLYQLISYFRNTTSYSFDNQLREISLKKLDSVRKMARERDVRGVEGFKDIALTYEIVGEYVTTNMQ